MKQDKKKGGSKTSAKSKQKKAAKRVEVKSGNGQAVQKKLTYRKSTDKVGDILVNQAGVKYKITGERYVTPKGFNDGITKIRMLEITPEKKTGIKPFETTDVTLTYYRQKKILGRVKK